ncbi:hypothetical protein BSZ39_00930 [Bowdeniella nasicola]|uniref:Sulfur carrier protein FdhD n=1 Tax=Bowdeniella nasicola TaxID=208480 RepID=A0A1Q5Q5C4_9ACTO|nr:hypothetical protein BSZ39_00930 [Bowdeniella nasicola]
MPVRIEIGGRADVVGVEEPLEIRVAGEQLTTTMRTPGSDVELVHGLLFAEGFITSGADISQVRYCGGVCGQNENTFNVLDVDLAPGIAPPDAAARRLLPTTSACGVCGTTSVEQIMARIPGRSPAAATLSTAADSARRADTAGHVGASAAPTCATPELTRFDPRVLLELPAALTKEQAAFRTTGGMHAVGIFTADGRALAIREDVGRHNAADKAIGHLLMSGALPAPAPAAQGDDADAPAILALSGRASFELVQKSVMARLRAVVAVSAASSLAIDLAADAGILLAGFTRDGRMNVYTGAELLAS